MFDNNTQILTMVTNGSRHVAMIDSRNCQTVVMVESGKWQLKSLLLKEL